LVTDIDKQKNIHPTNQLKYYQKNFQPDRPSRFGEKGGKPFSVTQKPILRKTRNIKKKFFFPTFLIMNYFRFYCIAH